MPREFVLRYEGIRLFAEQRAHSFTFQAKGDSTDQTTMDIDFYVDKNMVHISDTKIARHYGDYYVQQVLKLKESNKLILGAALTPVVPANTA